MLTMTSAVLAIMLQSPAPAVAATCPYAIVAGGPRDAEVSVYRTPSRAARKTGKLKAGSVIYVCGENPRWLWVHYRSGRYSCQGTANGLDGRVASTCANGWVERQNIRAAAR